MRHTVTVKEIRKNTISDVLASFATGGKGVSKRLIFKYDLNGNRQTYRVTYSGDGDGHMDFDTLEAAVECYNDL